MTWVRPLRGFLRVTSNENTWPTARGYVLLGGGRKEENPACPGPPSRPPETIPSSPHSFLLSCPHVARYRTAQTPCQHSTGMDPNGLEKGQGCGPTSFNMLTHISEVTDVEKPRSPLLLFSQTTAISWVQQVTRETWSWPDIISDSWWV